MSVYFFMVELLITRWRVIHFGESVGIIAFIRMKGEVPSEVLRKLKAREWALIILQDCMIWFIIIETTQLTFTYSKSTIERLEKDVKYVCS